MSEAHRNEIARKARFSFGENWRLYVDEVSEQRIAEAENSLKENLKLKHLAGVTFLDIGGGSGIFSLAARRLGATVTTFDYDPESVKCAKTPKEKFFGSTDGGWNIYEGSVLDKEFICPLGKFDIVYSWGVLHHTGSMWSAIDNALIPLAQGGKLFISIYNDQGRKSKIWERVKRGYVKTPKLFKTIYVLPFLIGLWGPQLSRDLLILKPFKTWFDYKKNRGMSPYRDLVDWIGGYPFEVASPGEIFSYLSSKGLILETLKTCAGGHGCNEYVFIKKSQ
jgi:2-polyprenyl-6-hydroxyphenyl methylase/3-demethylubiquinone-9 3-methyltransferase